MGVIIPIDHLSLYFIKAAFIPVINYLKLTLSLLPVALAIVCIANSSEIVNFHCMYDYSMFIHKPLAVIANRTMYFAEF
jgi:hypothetical protein